VLSPSPSCLLWMLIKLWNLTTGTSAHLLFLSSHLPNFLLLKYRLRQNRNYLFSIQFTSKLHTTLIHHWAHCFLLIPIPSQFQIHYQRPIHRKSQHSIHECVVVQFVWAALNFVLDFLFLLHGDCSVDLEVVGGFLVGGGALGGREHGGSRLRLHLDLVHGH